MKEDYLNRTNEISIYSGTGYHFSRFRAKDWHRLYIENLCGACKPGRSEEIRVLKLKGLYYMGILLMSVGFLICCNAIYRAPLIQKHESVLAVSSANTEAVGVWRDSGPRSPKGLGD